MSAENILDNENSSQPDWPVPQINLNLCDGCGLCVKVCPNNVLKLYRGKATVSLPLLCNYRGLCEQVCPTKAITRVFEIILLEKTDNE